MKNNGFSEIIDKLGLGPSAFHKRNIMESYLNNFYKKIKDYPREEDFQRSIMMALYVLDGIKDPNKIILVDYPNFEYDNKFYSIESHLSSWQGSPEVLRTLGEKGIIFGKIKKLIDQFNSEEIIKIFIYELFSNMVTFNQIEPYDSHIEIKFMSRFLIEKRNEGIKLLESNGL